MSAEKNGREGEAFAWSHIKKLEAKGVYSAIEWTSKDNAVSSYDFAVEEKNGNKILIDAKSTSGDFTNKIHMSSAELKAAAAAKRYDLWRIYKLSDDGARLQISKSISDFAKFVLTKLEPPSGVTIDSVSIDPSVLTWSSEIKIEPPDEIDGEE